MFLLQLACAREAAVNQPAPQPEPPSAEGLRLPAHAVWVRWDRGSGTDTLALEVTVVDDPGSGQPGLYFAPWNGTIDGTAFYFGLQTDVSRPGVGGIGKGLIFSRWGPQTEADIRVAPGGFFESSDHEGSFVGVRLPYAWKAGTYTLGLARDGGDAGGDWFRLDVTREGTSTWAGSLRVARADPSVPAKIDPDGIAFLEVYSGATAADDVSDWHVAVVPDPGVEAARSEYPAFPYAEFEHADAWVEGDAVHMAFGAGIARQHPAGQLLPPP